MSKFRKNKISNRSMKGLAVALAIAGVLFLESKNGFAQSFHYFKYQVADSNKTGYEALLTLFPDGSARARVKNREVSGENAAIYELSVADSTTPENMNLPVKQLIPGKAANITGITSHPLVHWPLFEFTKQMVQNLSFYTPTLIKYQEKGIWKPAHITELKEFSLEKVDTNLVKQFYATNDPYYAQLFGNIQTPGLVSRGGLTEKQKKMKIWMIIVTDQLDSATGKACKRDNENMAYSFSNIAKKMGLQPPVITNINGRLFNRASVLSAVAKINPGPDDMVIFYYSGHGYREPDDATPLPKMVLSNDYNMATLSQKSLEIAEVADSLSNKKSRFNLVINDCCNEEMVLARPVGKDPLISPKSIGLPVSTENFIKLFLEPKGTIIASSSMPKEYSVGNPEKGGFYTWYFRLALERQISQYKRDLSWEDIFLEAGKNANYLALTGLCGNVTKSRCIQTPWYDLSNMTQ